MLGSIKRGGQHDPKKKHLTIRKRSTVHPKEKALQRKKKEGVSPPMPNTSKRTYFNREGGGGLGSEAATSEDQFL